LGNLGLITIAWILIVGVYYYLRFRSERSTWNLFFQVSLSLWTLWDFLMWLTQILGHSREYFSITEIRTRGLSQWDTCFTNLWWISHANWGLVWSIVGLVTGFQCSRSDNRSLRQPREIVFSTLALGVF
jgi:hypothetical protein